jgi:AAA+ ATPase superfamily predicted ATPase
MKNIQFIDRMEELSLLESLESKNFFVVLRGRRRIGKTTLVRRAFPNAAYIFVWPNKSLQWIIDEVCREHNLPRFLNFADIVRHLLDKNRIVILDEFQNFLNIDKSVFGEIQKLIDDRRVKNERIRLVASGSSYSLINKLFSIEASPLYGRKTHEIMLQELPAEEMFKAFGMPLIEFIEAWSVFGGVPYYYTLIELNAPIRNTLVGMFKRRDSMLMEEGRAILSIEFGGESKAYSTVLTAIAEGKTRLNEIASLFSNKKSETIKYLDMLRKEFGLVRRVTPILADPRKSREGVYEISDNFLSFWFYFIDKQRSYVEQERLDEVINFLKDNFSTFVGRKFEKFVTYLLKRKLLLGEREFTRIGRQWGRVPGASAGKNQYEIDVVALNDKTKEILFAECKWQDRVNAAQVLAELREKAAHMQWHNAERKEHYAIFAKSFAKRVKEPRLHLFDLKDLDKAFK